MHTKTLKALTPLQSQSQLSSAKFHELMISYGLFTHVSDEEREILTSTETVRGIETNIGIEITNIGKSSFGGGVITRISFKAVALSIASNYTVNVEIPALEPDEKKHIIILTRFVVNFEGSARLSLLMNANDGMPIKTYRFKGGLATTNQWNSTLYIVNKEMFNIYQSVKRTKTQKKPNEDEST